jgi:mycothiol maleylpyruvate isomerase-like protein
MKPAPPVLVADLFPPLHEELLVLLRGLAPGDWLKPTIAGAWRVRDVAAHLLDGDIRRLSTHRDGLAFPPPETPIGGYGDLVRYLNALNADWLRVADRISPRLLVDLLAITGPQVAALFASLDPRARAFLAVSWAGEDASENWLDIGREYTERWHHQQQMRDAVGAPPLTARRWLAPMLEISVRALPFAYRDTPAADGQTIAFIITGEAGGSWSLRREDGHWSLFAGEARSPTVRVTIDQDSAWRLFFKALRRDEAARRVKIEGDRQLGEVVLGALAVMA